MPWKGSEYGSEYVRNPNWRPKSERMAEKKAKEERRKAKRDAIPMADHVVEITLPAFKCTRCTRVYSEEQREQAKRCCLCRECGAELDEAHRRQHKHTRGERAETCERCWLKSMITALRDSEKKHRKEYLSSHNRLADLIKEARAMGIKTEDCPPLVGLADLLEGAEYADDDETEESDDA